MLIEDLEESNEAGMIVERLEVNGSQRVDIVSALEDSNMASLRDDQ